ncbi:MAG: hypothetical protein QOI81_2091 [Actinomycetota bacterium]|nr:hypothetical protein [Actinomycetota bacterium]
MSDSLYEAFVQTRLRLERGIDDAQQELRETRDRCARLEGTIRSLRNQLSDAARPRPAPEPVAEATLVVVPDAVDQPPTPPAADETEEPIVAVAEAEDEGDPESLEVPTSYMPMLEELWDIARRADSGS